MKVSDHCPDVELLEDLISDVLPAKETKQWMEHLDHCDTCQQQVSRLHLPTDWQDDLSNLSNRPRPSKEILLLVERIKAIGSNNDADLEPNDRNPAQDQELDSRVVLDLQAEGYDVLGRLGRGGMGVVYKATDRSLQRMVAIKVLSPVFADDELARRRFLREARSAAGIVHPNVITIHAVSSELPRPYLVMEFVDGMTLGDYLASKRTISFENMLKIGRQITSALIAAHEKQVIHRDVKPANILIAAKSGRVLLGDFGLAQATWDSRITQSGAFVGTPSFVAPEVLEANGTVDHRSDLFSLGAVLYAMATGESPFQSDSLLSTLHQVSTRTPPSLHSQGMGVPLWFSEIVNRLLLKDAAARFQTARELKQALSDPSGHTGTSEAQPTIASHHGDGNTTSNSFPNVLVDKPLAKRRNKHRLSSTPLTWATVFIGLLIGVSLLAVWMNKTENQNLSDDDSNGTAKSSSLMESNGKPDINPGLNNAVGKTGIQSKRIDKPVFKGYGPDGKFVSDAESVHDAVESLPDGGRIVIEHNDEITVQRTIFIDQPIEITAADGSNPKLRFEANAEVDGEGSAMFMVESELTLNGLTLRFDPTLEDGDTAMFMLENRSSLSISRCQLTTSGEFLISGDDSRLVIIENSSLRSDGGSLLDLGTGPREGLVLDNSFLTASVVILMTSGDKEVIFNHCTIACDQVLELELDEDEAGHTVSIQASNSIIGCCERLVGMGLDAEEDDEEEDSAEEEDDDERLQWDRFIRWEGSENVYTGEVRPLPLQNGKWRSVREHDLGVDRDSAYVESPFVISNEEIQGQLEDGSLRLWEVRRKEGFDAGASRL